jgi:hypothetical protein
LLKAGIPDTAVEFYLQNYNKIPNLQLLEGTVNISKGNRPFEEWLTQTYSDQVAREQFKERHYLTGLDLSLPNFQEFYEKQREILKTALQQLVF